MDEVDEKLEVVEKHSVVWTLDAVALNLLGSEVKVYGKPLRLCVCVCVEAAGLAWSLAGAAAAAAAASASRLQCSLAS